MEVKEGQMSMGIEVSHLPLKAHRYLHSPLQAAGKWLAYRVRAQAERDTYVEFMAWPPVNHWHTMDFNFLSCELGKLKGMFPNYFVAWNLVSASEPRSWREAMGPEAVPPSWLPRWWKIGVSFTVGPGDLDLMRRFIWLWVPHAELQSVPTMVPIPDTL